MKTAGRYILVAVLAGAGGSAVTWWLMRGGESAIVGEPGVRAEVQRVASVSAVAWTEATRVTGAEAERRREVEELKQRLNVSERWLAMVFEEIDARSGAGGGSAFKSIVEAAQFTANLRRQQREFARAYPTLPEKGTEAWKEYEERLEKLNRDLVLALMDPLYAQELKSGDPERVAALQAAFSCARSGLSDERIAAMTPVVQEAFKELHGLYLDPLGATSEDPRVRDIEERMNAKLKALLSPEEWQALEANGCSQVLYVFYGSAI